MIKISLLPAVVCITLFLSGLPECLEFLVETTGKASVACMLNFSYEDSINVYSFIERVAYQLAQALDIDLHELHIGIFILILLQINYSYCLCNS